MSSPRFNVAEDLAIESPSQRLPLAEAMVGTPLAAPASSGPGQLQAAKSYIKDKQAKTTAAKTTELLKKGAKAKTDTKTDELRAELKRKVNEIKKMNKLKKELQKKHNKLIDGAPANSANQKAAKTTKKSSKPKSKEKKAVTR